MSSGMVRYADDSVLYFENETDARRVLEVLWKRLEKFGLSLHPEKTRLLDFRRPQQGKGESFNFLGFTW
jgi:RNA-directed DNA polymerase